MRRLGAIGLLATLALTIAAGCTSGSSTTQVVGRVDADATVRERTDALVIRVRGRAPGGQFTDKLERRLEAPLPWPVQIPIAPESGDAARELWLEAEAVDADGETVATVRATTSFLDGRSLALDLVLEQACIDVACDAAMTCRGGACTDAYVDPQSLPDFEEDRVPRDGGVRDAEVPDDAGDDGSVDPDGGPDDGGVDGSIDDAGPIDGGMCASLGAGDLVITEVMVSSRPGSDDTGEWFEVANARNCWMDLAGTVIASPTAAGSERTHEVSELVIGPRERVVFAFDPLANERFDLPFDYAYGTEGPIRPEDVILNNGGDALELRTAGGTTIDRVTYETGQFTHGRARQFPGGADPTGNDDWDVWCDAQEVYGATEDGDPLYGSPRDPSTSCEGPE